MLTLRVCADELRRKDEEIAKLRAELAVMPNALDEAWQQINALGGTYTDSYGEGVSDTVDKALDIIEALGGKDRT